METRSVMSRGAADCGPASLADSIITRRVFPANLLRPGYWAWCTLLPRRFRPLSKDSYTQQNHGKTTTYSIAVQCQHYM